MMNKRGSLSISTNAIVVLIIAVIMLGLIIGLVTRGFSAVERQFLGQIEENEPNPATPSPSQPITLSSQAKFASRGELVGFKVNILNTQYTEEGIPIVPAVECQPAGDGNPVEQGSDSAFSQTLSTNEVGNYLYSFQVKDSAQDNTYLCRIRAQEEGGDIIEDITAAQFRLTIE